MVFFQLTANSGTSGARGDSSSDGDEFSTAEVVQKPCAGGILGTGDLDTVPTLCVGSSTTVVTTSLSNLKNIFIVSKNSNNLHILFHYFFFCSFQRNLPFLRVLWFLFLWKKDHTKYCIFLLYFTNKFFFSFWKSQISV